MPFASLTFLLFLLCVCQVNLTNLKDALILTSNPQGAAVIPFIHVWALLPGSFLMTGLFMKLREVLGGKRASSFILLLFLGFFLLFAFVLFPREESLRLSKLAFFLELSLPRSCKSLISIIEHWPLTLFFVMSELWMSLILALFFWGFVNEHTKPNEAKKHYGFLQFGGTVSAFAAGTVANWLIQDVYDPSLPFGSNAWEQTLDKITLLVVFLGAIALVLQRNISDRVGLRGPDAKPEEKHSTKEALRRVWESPYLMSVLMLVLGYCLVFGTLDLIWKSKVREVYPDPNDIVRLTNDIMRWVGGISIAATLLIPAMMRRFGVSCLSLITPIGLAISSSLFFALYFFGHRLNLSSGSLSVDELVIYTGAIAVCLGKAFKFSVFDVSKEMAFTPLENEAKWSAKAVIDGIGKSIGTTSTNVTHQAFLFTFGTVAASAPYFTSLLYFMLVAWIVAAVRIGRKFTSASEESVSFVK